MDEPEGQYEIWGEVKVEPLCGKKIPFNAQLYLLVGPTGAGKSSFIESFSAESQKLSISKDQLEGYTQTATVYELMNVLWRSQYHAVGTGVPIYLIDTPGFSDAKISELEVMDEIRNCLESVGRPYVHRILFFIPINTPRLAGSRRRTLDIFKTLIDRNRRDIIFVTTMWDALHNDRVRGRAESNFVQLRDEILAGYVAGGATITRFSNTKQTPGEIFGQYESQSSAFFSHIQGDNPHGTIIYQDLLDRITSGQQKQSSIKADLDSPDAKAYPELRVIQERNLEENRQLLWKFIGQYLNFRDPPAEFATATFDVDKTIAEATGYLGPDSPYEGVLYEYNNHRHPNTIRLNWLKLHKRLQYAFNCEQVKSALREKEMIELDLVQRKTETNSEAESIRGLEQRQIEDQRVIIKVIGQWMQLGAPPQELHTVAQNLRTSVIAHADLVRFDSAYEDVFYLWEQQASWPRPFYIEQPEDNGVYSDSARTKLKNRRRVFESKLAPRVPISSKA